MKIATNIERHFYARILAPQVSMNVTKQHQTAKLELESICLNFDRLGYILKVSERGLNSEP